MNLNDIFESKEKFLGLLNVKTIKVVFELFRKFLI